VAALALRRAAKNALLLQLANRITAHTVQVRIGRTQRSPDAHAAAAIFHCVSRSLTIQHLRQRINRPRGAVLQ